MNENTEAVAAAGASPHFVKAWRRISTDEIGLHVSSVELRREVNATESLMLSREQARRLATDIYELLADDDPAGVSVAPQPQPRIVEIQQRMHDACDGIDADLVAHMRADIPWLLDQLKSAETASVATDNPCCSGCGGPHPFDTTVPSVVWNTVIRANGLKDYLCLTCIVRAFVARGQSFTAELVGGEFHFVPIEVRVNEQVAQDAVKISDENTALRVDRTRLCTALLVLRGEYLKQTPHQHQRDDILKVVDDALLAVLARERPPRHEEKEGV